MEGGFNYGLPMGFFKMLARAADAFKACETNRARAQAANYNSTTCDVDDTGQGFGLGGRLDWFPRGSRLGLSASGFWENRGSGSIDFGGDRTAGNLRFDLTGTYKMKSFSVLGGPVVKVDRNLSLYGLIGITRASTGARYSDTLRAGLPQQVVLSHDEDRSTTGSAFTYGGRVSYRHRRVRDARFFFQFDMTRPLQAFPANAAEGWPERVRLVDAIGGIELDLSFLRRR